MGLQGAGRVWGELCSRQGSRGFAGVLEGLAGSGELEGAWGNGISLLHSPGP